MGRGFAWQVWAPGRSRVPSRPHRISPFNCQGSSLGPPRSGIFNYNLEFWQETTQCSQHLSTVMYGNETPTLGFSSAATASLGHFPKKYTYSTSARYIDSIILCFWTEQRCQDTRRGTQDQFLHVTRELKGCYNICKEFNSSPPPGASSGHHTGKRSSGPGQPPGQSC